MIVRLLKPWKYMRTGTVLNSMPEGAANLLIRRGFGEEVKAEPKEQPRGFKRVSRA
jgi:hypothetical protein